MSSNSENWKSSRDVPMTLKLEQKISELDFEWYCKKLLPSTLELKIPLPLTPALSSWYIPIAFATISVFHMSFMKKKKCYKTVSRNVIVS